MKNIDFHCIVHVYQVIITHGSHEFCTVYHNQPTHVWSLCHKKKSQPH